MLSYTFKPMMDAPKTICGSREKGHDKRSSTYNPELACRQAIGGALSQLQPAAATLLAASAARLRALRHGSLSSPSIRQIASAARLIDARALHIVEHSPAFSKASHASSNSEKSAVIAFSRANRCGIQRLFALSL